MEEAEQYPSPKNPGKDHEGLRGYQCVGGTERGVLNSSTEE